MLDALLKVWPILAALFGAVTLVLGWIGMGVWKVSRWTASHDSRVETLQEVQTLHGEELRQLKAKSTEHGELLAMHGAFLEAKRHR